MCLSRRVKGYFTGCAECGWWAKRRKKVEGVLKVARRDNGIKNKFKCPECGEETAMTVDGKGGDYSICMNIDCEWEKGEPLHRPPSEQEVKSAGSKKRKTKKKKKRRGARQTADGVAPKAGGGSSTKQKVKTKSGKVRSTGIGDKVATELAKCDTIKDMVKYAKKMGIGDAKKYLTLPNPGLARMSIGNRVRGILRKAGKL
jgi:hypothetical protein